MKYSDVQKMLEAGLISQDQAQSITAHFKLSEDESSRFLTIVAYIGAALVTCGIILLIASNWDAIPRGVKIGGGIALMLGAHAAGWFLRENPGKYPKSGEALHVVGAAAFLANVALIGQIYHLASRLPNAFLLWWAGIAILPWALRSKGLHVLALAAFTIWFGTELNHEGSLIYLGDATQILMYALLGLLFLGCGYLLRGTRYDDFASPTEKLGVFGLIACTLPLMWGILPDLHDPQRSKWAFPVLLLLAVISVVAGTVRRKELPTPWRWTWAGSLLGLAALLAVAYCVGVKALAPYLYIGGDTEWIEWVSVLALFVFSIVQIRVGVQLRSRFLVNTATATIAVIIGTAYVKLFGSMAQTGLVFLVGGVILIGLGFYLEKQRRALVKQIRIAQ